MTYIIIGAIELGLIFSILSIGLFLTFKVLNLPDLTVDASFVTGLAISSIFTLSNNLYLGLILSVIGGAIAGLITGILHTKLKINAILSSILTMTALYSINIRIMDNKASIYIGDNKTIFDAFSNKFYFDNYDLGNIFLLIIIVVTIALLMYLFLKTQIGLSLRATGDNEDMVKSSSINTDFIKILGFVLSNALVGFAGSIYGQYSKTASIGVGTGMLVLGLASIIIGEVFIKKEGIGFSLLSIIIGSIFYRFILTLAFQIGLPATDIKLFSAIIVIFAIYLPSLKWRKKC